MDDAERLVKENGELKEEVEFLSDSVALLKGEVARLSSKRQELALRMIRVATAGLQDE